MKNLDGRIAPPPTPDFELASDPCAAIGRHNNLWRERQLVCQTLPQAVLRQLNDLQVAAEANWETGNAQFAST
jgi:hypothetical protein